MTTFGYCRISRRTQDIDRQVRNIKAKYPDAVIIKEAYTGTSIDRPKWNRLYKQLSAGDRVVFDSVSRMSRSGGEGSRTYQELYERGVDLVFLKEPYIDTATYRITLQGRIGLTGTDIDVILDGVNKYLVILAKEQIRLAFEQAEKEVMDLRQRTREGIITARLKGRQIGARPGRKVRTKKCLASLEGIRKYSRDFDGTLKDKDVMAVLHLSRNTYYKYKHLLKAETLRAMEPRTGRTDFAKTDPDIGSKKRAGTGKTDPGKGKTSSTAITKVGNNKPGTDKKDAGKETP